MFCTPGAGAETPPWVLVSKWEEGGGARGETNDLGAPGALGLCWGLSQKIWMGSWLGRSLVPRRFALTASIYSQRRRRMSLSRY